MNARVGPELALVLRGERDELNRRFMAARKSRPHFDDERFRAFLCTTLNDLAVAAAQQIPSEARDVVLTAYDLGLEQISKNVPDPDAKLAGNFVRVAASAMPAVALAPRRVLASIFNAIVELGRWPGARRGDWIDTMVRLGPQVTDPETFLRAGIVAGWTAGMAHHREGALRELDRLPDHVACSVLNTPRQWPTLRETMLKDPWFAPDGRMIPLVRCVGAFRGFGGVFIAPPIAERRADHFVMKSGATSWLLMADAFGATFHRATDEEANAPIVTAAGKEERSAVMIVDRKLTLPLCGSPTGIAISDTTAVVSTDLGHKVAIVALTVLK